MTFKLKYKQFTQHYLWGCSFRHLILVQKRQARTTIQLFCLIGGCQFNLIQFNLLQLYAIMLQLNTNAKNSLNRSLAFWVWTAWWYIGSYSAPKMCLHTYTSFLLDSTVNKFATLSVVATKWCCLNYTTVLFLNGSRSPNIIFKIMTHI